MFYFAAAIRGADETGPFQKRRDLGAVKVGAAAAPSPPTGRDAAMRKGIPLAGPLPYSAASARASTPGAASRRTLTRRIRRGSASSTRNSSPAG